MILVSAPWIGEEEKAAAQRVLESGWFIHGKELEGFENEFAAYVGTNFGVGCSNGTTAIELALQGLGIGPGDQVIVPSHTAFPTVEPIYNLGAIPVFVDITEATYTLDPQELEQKYTEKVKAAIGVHLYGHPFEVKPVWEFCNEKGIFMIEDACQAHGAEFHGRKVGGFGEVACFSFYPSKNMTTGGDGGMVVTNNAALAENIRMLRNHGQRTRYDSAMVGTNYRLSELHAAIGREQLKKLEVFLQRRREIAKIYQEELPAGVILPVEKEWARHVYHLFVVRSERRDFLKAELAKREIASEIHYPIPVHKLEAVRSDASLPVTERVVKEILSVPMHPRLTDDDVMTVARAIRDVLK